MHSAPAVSYPVGRSRFHGQVVLVLGVCALLTLTAWLWPLQAHSQGLTLRVVGAVVLGCCAGLLAGLAWVRTPQGSLAWDGQNWLWCCTNQPQTLALEESQQVSLDVTLDFQSVLLLRLTTAQTGQSIWVWLERRTAPLRWMAFRRAVFGRVPAADVLDQQRAASRAATGPSP